MRFCHRVARATLTLSVILEVTACKTNPDANELSLRIKRSLSAAAGFMVSRQSDDGAWRSEVYGNLKDGPSLTTPIVKCLFLTPNATADEKASAKRGVDYLVKLLGEVRTNRQSLVYPVYTAGLASGLVLLNHAPQNMQAAWLSYLLQHRLSTNLGWTSRDACFGGWGYATRPPRKLERAASPYEANLSATVFGIAALRQARVSATDPVYREVREFVERCQNFSTHPEYGDPRFDDGGFFFTPCDPGRNKAGVAGIDRQGRGRFNSYGSTTADGLRALLRCGLSRDHPRVRAAQRWLGVNFTVSVNPGTFAPDREVLRNATYYYYCWSLAHAFMALGIERIETQQGTVDWTEALAEELLRRQHSDGSWANRFSDGKEDDPLVATPLAAAALNICYRLRSIDH